MDVILSSQKLSKMTECVILLGGFFRFSSRGQPTAKRVPQSSARRTGVRPLPFGESVGLPARAPWQKMAVPRHGSPYVEAITPRKLMEADQKRGHETFSSVVSGNYIF